MGSGVIARLPGWEARLSAHIVSHLNAPFVWGKTDCAMFAAGSVKALSGVDIARGFRGYRTAREGVRLALKKGFRGHEEIFAERLRAVPVEMLAPGDVVVIEEAGEPAMAVFGGASVHVMTPAGCQTVPADRISRGYAV